jgi:hypothetical protein
VLKRPSIGETMGRPLAHIWVSSIYGSIDGAAD